MNEIRKPRYLSRCELVNLCTKAENNQLICKFTNKKLINKMSESLRYNGMKVIKEFPYHQSERSFYTLKKGVDSSGDTAFIIRERNRGAYGKFSRTLIFKGFVEEETQSSPRVNITVTPATEPWVYRHWTERLDNYLKDEEQNFADNYFNGTNPMCRCGCMPVLKSTITLPSMIDTTEFREVEILENRMLYKQKLPIQGMESKYIYIDESDEVIRKLQEHKQQKEIEEERLLYLLEFQNSLALRASETILEKRKEEEQERLNAILVKTFRASAERAGQSLRKLGKAFVMESEFNKTAERFYKVIKVNINPEAKIDGKIQGEWNMLQITKDLYITRIIFNKKATVVFFSDDTKEIVKRAKGEKDCKSTAVNAAICNKLLVCSKTKLEKYINKFMQ